MQLLSHFLSFSSLSLFFLYPIGDSFDARFFFALALMTWTRLLPTISSNLLQYVNTHFDKTTFAINHADQTKIIDWQKQQHTIFCSTIIVKERLCVLVCCVFFFFFECVFCFCFALSSAFRFLQRFYFRRITNASQRNLAKQLRIYTTKMGRIMIASIFG